MDRGAPIIRLPRFKKAVQAGSKRSISPIPKLSLLLPSARQQRDGRNCCEDGTSQKRSWWAERIPERACNDTCQQQCATTNKIKYPEARSEKFRRSGICYKFRQQPLCKRHMQAPESGPNEHNQW